MSNGRCPMYDYSRHSQRLKATGSDLHKKKKKKKKTIGETVKNCIISFLYL